MAPPVPAQKGWSQEDDMGRAETCMAWSLERAEQQEGSEGAGAKGQKQQAVDRSKLWL